MQKAQTDILAVTMSAIKMQQAMNSFIANIDTVLDADDEYDILQIISQVPLESADLQDTLSTFGTQIETFVSDYTEAMHELEL